VVGDRVYLAPGAKVFGPIRVGHDVAVGANAVVNRDVPEGVTVAGVPAKIVSTHGSRQLIELGRDAARPQTA
jgi:serine O-acetyltransferase